MTVFDDATALRTLTFLAISGGVTLHGMARMSPLNLVGPGWFAAFGTRLVEGRDVTSRDRAGTPGVALANKTFARKFLDGASPLGHTITSTVGQPPLKLSIEIVGVERADTGDRGLNAVLPGVLSRPGPWLSGTSA